MCLRDFKNETTTLGVDSHKIFNGGDIMQQKNLKNDRAEIIL